MFSFWLVIAIAAGLSSNLFNFLSRYYLKEGHDPTAFGWILEVIRMLSTYYSYH